MTRRRHLCAVIAGILVLALGAAPGAVSTASAAPPASSAALKSKVKVDKKATLILLPATYGKKKVATAKFGTGYKGRVVSLQYKDGSKWKQAASATMDAKGRATFTVGFLKNGKTYRAVADTYRIRNAKTGATKSVKPVRTPTVEAGSQWKRVLRDGFSGTKLKKRWEHGQVGQFYGSRLCSAVDPSRTRVADGKLVASIRQLNSRKAADKKVIKRVTKAAKAQQEKRRKAAIKAAKKLTGKKRKEALAEAKAMKVDGCPHGVFYNARVDTKNTFHMTEGMVAARVKFPKAQGMHGSVWLQTTRGYSERPIGTEIDLIESFGYGKGVTNIIHVDDKRKGALNQYGGYVIKEQTKDPKWWDRYHTYSVEWTRSEYVFRIDGVETQRIRRKGVKGDQHFLAISMLASDWETKYIKSPSGKLPGIKKADLSKAKMYVEWVEAWERA
jgi:hypothetical protein